MSNDKFTITVKRTVDSNGWGYYRSSETKKVEVLDPVPGDLFIENIVWKDEKKNHSFTPTHSGTYMSDKSPATWLEVDAGIRTVADLADAIRKNAGFLKDFYKSRGGFGKVSVKYLEATVKAYDPEAVYYGLGEWPYAINVPLPDWIRNEVVDVVEGKMTEEELKVSVRDAARSVIEEHLREKLTDSIQETVEQAVQERRKALEEEMARMDSVLNSFN